MCIAVNLNTAMCSLNNREVSDPVNNVQQSSVCLCSQQGNSTE